MKKTKEEKM